MEQLVPSGDSKVSNSGDQKLPRGTQYCLIEFEKPVLCQEGTKASQHLTLSYQRLTFASTVSIL